VTGLFIFLIGIEYLSLPVPTYELPTGSAIPGSYRFLEQQVEPGAVLELPLFIEEYDFALDALYTYFACYHDFHVVNGYSGHFPPQYRVHRRIMNNFPDKSSLLYIDQLGLDYILIHTDIYRELGKLAEIGEQTKALQQDFQLIYADPYDWILKRVK